ncbi:MAG: flagellar export chaperone FliS [Gammaproteobacteria bacterium]|nr:flagellar export chaperone FliS [Gammaproteobacteria bacterium]
MDQYIRQSVQGGVESATPHRLIQMLMEGALDKIAAAKFNMEQNEIAKKGENISVAISIIDGLRVSLDKPTGGEIAQNLDDLYEYMGHNLLQANLKNDVNLLDEVSKLLNKIKGAWDAIPNDIVMDHASKVKGEHDKTVSNVS